jgi:hypothetical protein
MIASSAFGSRTSGAARPLRAGNLITICFSRAQTGALESPKRLKLYPISRGTGGWKKISSIVANAAVTTSPTFNFHIRIAPS